MSREEGVTKFVVRMPDEMHARIKESARRNRRSMNSEMLVLLETGQLALIKAIVIDMGESNSMSTEAVEQALVRMDRTNGGEA